MLRPKEEPLIDERIPHPYREVIKELRAIRAQLEEIKLKLVVAPVVPPIIVKPPAAVVAPPVPAISLSKEEFEEIYVEALAEYGALILADELYIQTIDLGTDRSTSDKIEEFSMLAGIALTVFRNTGAFDLYINKKDDPHKLPIANLLTPHLSFKAKTYYIGNNPQAGKEAILVAWKKEGESMSTCKFEIELSDEDLYVLLTLCRNMRMSKQQFIMAALKTHIEKIQEEWRMAQKAGIKGAPEAVSPPLQPDKDKGNTEKKESEISGNEKESEKT